MSYLKFGMRGTALPVRNPIGIDARPLLADTPLKDFPDRGVKSIYLHSGKASGTSHRMNPGCEEGFIRPHIADARHRVLIAKENLDRHVTACGKIAKPVGAEAIPQRLGTELSDDFIFIRYKPDGAEFALIDEVQVGTAIKAKHRRGVVLPRLSRWLEQKHPAHLEMKDQGLAA